MRNLFIQLLTAVCCLWAVNAYAKINLDTPPEVPPGLNSRDFRELMAMRESLMGQFDATRQKIDRQAANCQSVEKGSPKATECAAEAQEVKSAVKDYRNALERFKLRLADEIENARLIKAMNALAKRLGWSAEEQARLDKALNSLDDDGDPATSAQIIHVWDDVLARGQEGDFSREASQGDGPVFPGAGTQSFEDCTVFALANAAGLPYGVAAARAAKLIGEGEWRSAADRANPQKAIEQNGLNGGEVVMLAESFGQAEVVTSANFAKTLKEGRPVMVDVVPENGNVNKGHEVVLTKTFQHGGETWYEMMDSNQGPQRRLYLSAKELGTIQQENGVAFRPEPGTVPKLLR